MLTRQTVLGVNWLRWALVGWVVMVGGVCPLVAHPDKVEDRLLLHFATGSHAAKEGRWEDLTHRAEARIMGAPRWTNVGPAQAVVLNGYHDWFLVASNRTDAAKFLPTKEMTVSAWVFLEDTIRLGGLVGFVQDNGAYEKGWFLGYRGTQFVWSLNAVGGSQGDSLTTLPASTRFELGRWHHVVGTYDGESMKIYVNGKLEGENRGVQTGDLDYPERGRLALGAYVDDDEVRSMEGGFYEVKVYGRVWNQEEVQSVTERNRALLDYRSSVNTRLQFVVPPYLQAAGKETMTVMSETAVPSRMVVEYGERQPLQGVVSNDSLQSISEVKLTGLKEYTQYFYRVTRVDAEGNVARSDVFTMQTAPSADIPWAFGILGDTQRNPDVTRRCAEGIFALRPNFMLHCGDVVDDGFAKHQWVNDLFLPAQKLFAHVPTFPVIGNHEKNSHWYYDYFSLPPPEYQYTFQYGNAEFFMVDSNKDCSKGSPQYEWLEKALKASRATWKFAAHHHPCFSSDEDDYGDRWRGKTQGPFLTGDRNAQKLVPLYEKYGVDVVFAGHIHSYERTWPILNMTINQKRGVRYVVSGGGGGGLEQAAPQRAWFSVHVARGHHYCFAAVHDRTIEFKALDVDGKLWDTFSLTKDKNR